MCEVTVRRMRSADLDEVMQIERLSFSTPWSRESFRLEIEENRCAYYIVLAEDGRVVAYAGTWLAISEGHITNIAVHPDFRGRGYGKRITRELMEQCLDIGITWMTLEVRRSNLIAQGIYTSLGFKSVGVRRRYYEDNGEDAFIMVVENLQEALGLTRACSKTPGEQF